MNFCPNRNFVLAALIFTCSAVALAQVYDESAFSGIGKESRSVLMINTDGSCRFTVVRLDSRTTAEQQVRTRERYEKTNEATEAGDNAAQADLTATNAVEPFTDEGLAKKISEPLLARAEDTGEKVGVQVKSNVVQITTSREFVSLEEMLRESYGFWQAGSLSCANARLETDTNGLLRLTLTPQPGMNRYFKTLRSEWKSNGVSTELKLVFPGRVVSSDFPETATNATWITMDGKRDETLDAVMKLYVAPTVIIAEPNGLKLDRPLESKTLWRSRGRGDTGGGDLPITDAGPGFIAEAQGITTTMLRVFPGGEDYFKHNSAATGAVVQASLFAPRGRTLQSISDLRVIAAVDNRGRSIAAEADGENVASEVDARGPVDVAQLNFQLRFHLPAADAQAIDKISAEAVAVTAGSWKEMNLTNLQENATNEMDLSAVLPGAKLAITKISTKNRQFTVQARLVGPATIKQLELRLKIPENERAYSSSSERQFTIKNGAATRTLMLQGWGMDSEDTSAPGKAIIVVRYPQDLRRERVKFELHALDLL